MLLLLWLLASLLVLDVLAMWVDQWLPTGNHCLETGVMVPWSPSPPTATACLVLASCVETLVVSACWFCWSGTFRTTCRKLLCQWPFVATNMTVKYNSRFSIGHSGQWFGVHDRLWFRSASSLPRDADHIMFELIFCPNQSFLDAEPWVGICLCDYFRTYCIFTICIFNNGS